MANGESTADLLINIMRNIGEIGDGTSPYHETALDYLNQFHRAFHAGSCLFDIDFGQVWTWAKEEHPNVILLQPAYETGVVSLTNGSASGTFGTPPSESYAGRMLRVIGRPDVFRIVTHSTPFASFTLDSTYTDDTGASLAFECFKVDYTLDQVEAQKIMRLIAPMTIYRGQQGEDFAENSGFVYGLDFLAFRKKYPPKYMKAGVPTHFCETKDTDGVKKVRFNRYPSEVTRVEYEYVQRPNALDDDENSLPNLPLEGRNAIEYAATYKLMLDKEDDRADRYLGLAQASLRALVASKKHEGAHTGGARGQLIPRPEQVTPQRALFKEDAY